MRSSEPAIGRSKVTVIAVVGGASASGVTRSTRSSSAGSVATGR